jgi:hypothetical protein
MSMKIKFLATGQSPDYYTFSGNTITAHHGGQTETYDLSGFPEGGEFQDADPVNGVPAVRHVERDAEGLKVTLCQQVGPGHWQESGWMDAASYDPDAVHVVRDSSKPHAGKPWAKTRQGKVFEEEVA